MNKLVTTLGATTLLFAGTTFYFWQKLQSLDAAGAGRLEMPAVAAEGTPHAVDAPGVPFARPADRVAGTATSVAQAAATNAANAASPAQTKAPGSRPDPSREMMQPYARDWLRQYDDPAQRTSLLKAARAGIDAQYSRLRDRLKLDAGTYGQLVDLLTQEQLEQQANYFRCAIDSTCDTSNLRPPRDHSDEYLAVLGPDAFAQLNAYRQAMPEWQAVVQLRGRLGEANYLRDGDAERLLSAMSAERERYQAESNQSGVKLRGWGTGTGTIWYSGDGGVEEQLASATQYSDRMRQRAASILNPEQLRAFAQIQEELLANFASYLRQQSGG